jgi:RNA polymerase sigma-70 factor (ECF subfamily)
MHVTGPVCNDGLEQPDESDCLAAEEARPRDEARQRLAQAASEGFDFLWRLLRRLGVRPEASVDDAVQRVFEIAARKTLQVPAGMERAFLFRTAVLVAAEERRRQQQTLKRNAGAEAADLASPELDPERALAVRRERELLDELLDELPEKLRTVFVLFELEGMTTVEIAHLLEVPAGTAASRLRLARQHFHDGARRLRARQARSNP